MSGFENAFPPDGAYAELLLLSIALGAFLICDALSGLLGEKRTENINLGVGVIGLALLLSGFMLRMVA